MNSLKKVFVSLYHGKARESHREEIRGTKKTNRGKEKRRS